MSDAARSLAEECDYLKSCINDLVGLLGLRPIWAGADHPRVAEMLADVLFQMLRPTFVVIRLFDWHDAGNTECVRLPADCSEEFGTSVRSTADAWFKHETRLGSHSLKCSIASQEFPVLALDLGMRGEFGFIFVGSDRATFPTSAERLLLNSAGSQALIALQQHSLLQEQKDVAARLDALVAQRSLELERATEALRRSETLMAQAESVSKTGSFRWHPVKDTLEWSAQAYRLFGFEPGRSIMRDDFFSRIDPDDQAKVKAVGARAVVAPMDLDLIFTVNPPGKAPRIVHLIGRPGSHASDQGEYVGTMQDITERVRGEETRRLAEIRMRELRDELAHANRLATLGQFSASISHDVRQPLSSVAANAMAGMNWLTAATPNLNAARSALDRVINGVKRAADILDRVKSFSRQNAPCVVVDLNELVNDTVALVGSDASRRHIQLTVNLASELPPLLVDRVQIQQVLMNLVVNALDSFESAESEQRAITVSTGTYGEEVCVEVRDTGSGLSDAALPRLFEAFNTTKATGLGMGLSICRDILAGYDGRIWTDRNAPHGAVFSFAIPINVPTARHHAQ